MHISVVAGILLALLPMCAFAGKPDVPVLLSLNSDLGKIYVDRMHLEVGILGVYSRGQLRPEINIGLTEILSCPDPNEECEASRSVSRTHDQVDELISSLTEAQERLDKGTPYKVDIGLTRDRRTSSSAFRGTVTVDPASRTVQFAPESSNAISLNANQAAGFLALLMQANAILEYLKPKFDAFNAAPVRNSVESPLDRAAYRQSVEELL